MNPWAPFQFLIGNWSSPASEQPGAGVTGSTTFAYDLNQNVLIRRSRAEYSPGPGETQGLVHEDLLIIYRQSGETLFRAIYFDNESHVINYVVSFPARQPSIVLDSTGDANGPRARLVYEMAEDGSLSIEFFVAPPGGELLSHVKGIVIREED